MKRFLAAALALVAAHAFAWTPPDHPDPEAILREAVQDRVAGRYEDALAKHQWFEREALKVKPSLYGVRNTFALAWWSELADLYGPALTALKALRDEKAQAVRDHDNPAAFADFAAINRELDDPLATVALFLETEKRDPALARKIYRPAEEALLQAKYYQVAARYVDPKKELESIVLTYRNLGSRPAPSDEVDMKSLNERFLGTQAGRLAALLVLVERKPEAEQVAKDTLAVSNSETVKASLDGALQGQMPPPFISREARRSPAPAPAPAPAPK